MADTQLQQLPEDLRSRVAELSDAANELTEGGQLVEAQQRFEQALALFPEPAERWEGRAELLAAVGDVLFSLRKYNDALGWLERAAGAPEAEESAWLELRLGQVRHELGDAKSEAHLARALELGGPEQFDDEDPKYFAVASSVVSPPAGFSSWDEARLP
ncbi:MAG: hypothetical protein H6718_20565 [Polyangiaceae bacterium]|nr:hypothetical protein [Myxococcales bacterium]MCB9587809.1 hypothetical protein [Polyangiaceae bacterium]MCB9608758.1 hypothetical protein [Polyangiaceae bacterium]